MDIQHATELKYFKVRRATVLEAEPICKWVCNIYYTGTTLRINSSDLLKRYWFIHLKENSHCITVSFSVNTEREIRGIKVNTLC